MKPQIKSLKPEEQATLKLRGLYEQFGYKKYRMGRFEEYSLYAENKRFLAGEKVITFTDLDGKLLALKPDVTLSIIKNTKADLLHTEKLYYIENVYRESKESHTYQEISQMGLEHVGAVDLYTILEVLILAEKSLSAVSPHFLLEISHMGFVVGFLDSLAASPEEKRKFLSCIRRKNAFELRQTAMAAKLSPEEIDRLCRIPSLYGSFSDTLKRAKAIACNEAMEAAVLTLTRVYEALCQVGMAKKTQLDFSMINDIDYYNGVIFQGYIDGLPRSVLAGGQYDQTMRRLGKNAEAMGFALYLNEISRLPMEQASYDVEALVLYSESASPGQLLKAVQELVSLGLRVRTERMIPKGLRYESLYRFDGNRLIKEEERSC